MTIDTLNNIKNSFNISFTDDEEKIFTNPDICNKYVAVSKDQITEHTILYYGNLVVREEDTVMTHNLKYILGSLQYYKNNITSLDNLEYISNIFYIDNATKFIGKLDNLNYIKTLIYNTKTDMVDDINYITNMTDIEYIQIHNMSNIDNLYIPNTVETLYIMGPNDFSKVNYEDGNKKIKLIVNDLVNLKLPNTVEDLDLTLKEKQNSKLCGIIFKEGIKKIRIQGDNIIDNLNGTIFPKSLKSLDTSIINNYRGAKFTEGIRALKIHGSRINNIVLPNTLKKFEYITTIWSNSDSIMDNIILPNNLEELKTNVETISNIKLPNSLKILDLYGVKTLQNVVFPKELNNINLYRIENLDNVVFPEQLNNYQKIILEPETCNDVFIPESFLKYIDNYEKILNKINIKRKTLIK